MIRAHFNLKDHPFKKDIACDQLFESSVFKEGIQRLGHIKDTRGMMLLTGDPGQGKTSLLRQFSKSLNPQHYQVYYLPLATVTVMDFYRQLNTSITGAYIHRKSDLFASIQREIKSMVQNRKMVPVFIFDEAHLLRNDNFHELQIILNFDFDSVNPAIVVLCGQSYLRDRLSKTIHLSVSRRISLKYHMIPLSEEETTQFIIHGLQRVGGSQGLFSDAALQAIFNNSQGNLHAIANIAEKALMVAASSGIPSVSENEVFLASKEL